MLYCTIRELSSINETLDLVLGIQNRKNFKLSQVEIPENFDLFQVYYTSTVGGLLQVGSLNAWKLTRFSAVVHFSISFIATPALIEYCKPILNSSHLKFQLRAIPMQ